jgi:fructose/tagatose bisphosphate aldolase
VPTAFLLNEVWELRHAVRGVFCGFNVVMLNTRHLPFAENVDLTRQVVEAAHPQGVEVQAELGCLPDFGAEDVGSLTDPNQARSFVQATGVDCLAVSIGNVHLQTVGQADIDFPRLQALRAAAEVPLVLHGGSGFSDGDVRAAIQKGVSLFHVGTKLKKTYLEAAQEVFRGREGEGRGRPDYQALVGSRKPDDFLLPGKLAIKEMVQATIRLYGSAGQGMG